MQQTEQTELLAELLGLKEAKQCFLDERMTQSPVEDYTDPRRFERERARVFGELPQILAHSSELAQPNGFLRRELNRRPLLLTRGEDGEARVFLNVCRHRGTRLVDDATGCRQRFTCPYHAWTWNNRGDFIGAPHFDAGFPDLDRTTLGLRRVPTTEAHGFIWTVPAERSGELSQHLAPLEEDLAWIGTQTLTVHDTQVHTWRCNWKLLVEGGLEAYHFRVAHRKTIAALFNDNLSSYRCFGPHIRSVLPRSTIAELNQQPPEAWCIRDYANVLYTVFPTSMLLVQADHVIWVGLDAQGPAQTQVRVATLKPSAPGQDDSYWDRNHALTVATLREDFELAESMQAGMGSGANTALRFGRFEGALHRFNETVRAAAGRA
ncbi:MAG: aromatic ring-hydroxylating dioxygenase subunit alpha [Pseudomonadota bacterium]